MVKEFKKLTPEESKILFKAPVLVSVLAACTKNGINKEQRADAIKLAHLKTFTANSLLLPFYDEVEKTFEEDFDSIAKKYAPFDEANRDALKKEIEKIERVLPKLDHEYATILHKSFDKYAKHVKKAAHSVFQDFIFPIPIKGLSD